MRLAVISDIHGNYPALKAALKDSSKNFVDQIVCLGDVLAFGPQPHECIRELLGMDCPVVLGNTDDWILKGNPFENGEDQMGILGDQLDWCRAQLGDVELNYIRSFEPTFDIALGNGNSLLAFHGSPASYNDIIMPDIGETDLSAFFAKHSAEIYTGGHTHLRMMRRFDHVKTFFNPGSVGLPFLTSPMDEPRKYGCYAEYAILSVDAEGTRLEFQQLALDLNEIVQPAFETDFPHKERWIEGWKLGFDLNASP